MLLMMREGFVIIKTLPRPRKTLRRGLTLGGRKRSEEDVCFRSLQKARKMKIMLNAYEHKYYFQRGLSARYEYVTQSQYFKPEV